MPELKKVNDAIWWGNTLLENRLLLAPMAGPGGLSFRAICERFDVALTVTELCSARAIAYDPTMVRNHRYLSIRGLQKPTVIQLFAFDPDDVKKAVPAVLSHPEYGKCAAIDINMGCPVPKIVKTGAGSALMKTPDLAARIVEVAVKEAEKFNKDVTVKIRSGWDSESINAAPFAALMERAGAKAIALHARTRNQMYGGKADWTIIGEVANEISVPLAANGDIATLSDCYEVLNVFSASACMIGRACLGQPWLFQRILSEEARDTFSPPKGAEWSKIVLEHFDGLLFEFPAEQAVREFRSSLVNYIRGFSGAAAYRNKVMRITEVKELRALINEIGIETSTVNI